MNKFLKPIKEKRKYYENNPEQVENILKEGTKKAREKAKEQMEKIRKAMMIDYK